MPGTDNPRIRNGRRLFVWRPFNNIWSVEHNSHTDLSHLNIFGMLFIGGYNEMRDRVAHK